MRHLLAALLFLPLIASSALAQSSPDQDANLIGLKKAFLSVVTNEGALTQVQLDQIRAAAALELRKAGLRLAASEDETDIAQDAVITLGIYKIGRALSTDAIIRLTVYQGAQVARTQKTVALNTWFYEDNGRNVVFDQYMPSAVRKGVDTFLNAWLEANGR